MTVPRKLLTSSLDFLLLPLHFYVDVNRGNGLFVLLRLTIETFKPHAPDLEYFFDGREYVQFSVPYGLVSIVFIETYGNQFYFVIF